MQTIAPDHPLRTRSNILIEDALQPSFAHTRPPRQVVHRLDLRQVKRLQRYQLVGDGIVQFAFNAFAVGFMMFVGQNSPALKGHSFSCAETLPWYCWLWLLRYLRSQSLNDCGTSQARLKPCPFKPIHTVE